MISAMANMRAMRHRLRSALKRGLVAVLDVGSSKTSCLIVSVDHARLMRAAEEPERAHDVFGALRIVGAGVTRSRGVRLGEIVDMEEAQRAIRTALELAEKMAGARVDQVIGSFSGGRPASLSSHGAVEVEGVTVTERDIARALARCPSPVRREGREILHAMPVNFALDGQTGLADPRGMAGRMLEVDMHVLTVASAPLRNLALCMRRCDLELAGVVAAPYAAALAGLVEDERKLGAACIDLGAGSTSVSIFLGDHLIYADSVRLGGDHLTQDIATGLAIPSNAAERIKTFHGGAVATGVDDREMIEAPHLGDQAPGERRRISRAALIGVLRPRLEEILEAARDKLEDAGFSHMPGRRITLVGGGSQLPGVEDVAQRVFGRRVRIGRPFRLAGLPQSATGPSFAAAVGLAIYAAKPQDEIWDFEAPGALDGRRGIRRAVGWFVANW